MALALMSEVAVNAASADRNPHSALPPHVQIIQMGVAIWKARAVYAAAELGLADALSQGPRTAVDLATLTQTHAPSLHRLLRALASVGILTEIEPGTFATTQLGDALRDGAPGGARATILTIAGAWQWKAWDHFLDALRTGESGLSAAVGQDLFDFLAANPQDSARFNEAMVGMHGAVSAAVVDAYGFSRFESIIDIGGGTGGLLSVIMRVHPDIRGALFDLPATARQARRCLAEAKCADRCEVLEGDFFKAVPANHDAYILSHVLHDWTDERAVCILQNCRRAIRSNGTLLIVEGVLPEGDIPHNGKLMDLLMLTVTGGCERSELQFAQLLEAARFKLSRVITTAIDQSIVEAIPI
jgi:SAM-dependent methyltransferase